MWKRVLVFCLGAWACGAWGAASEITVDLQLDNHEYVEGERIRGVVNIVNVSPDGVSVGYDDSKDRFFIEVFRSSDHGQLESVSDRRFVSPFQLGPSEGQKLETFLGDHYGLRLQGRYLARAVLVHDGVRYEAQYRAFDIVPGIRIGGAMQMFANHEGLRREFELVTWSRNRSEHLFLKAHDAGESKQRWVTTDLGTTMRITKPTISIMKTGEVVVLHRLDPESFVRSEFWSVPQGIEFVRIERVQDPETAGSARVRELYQRSGGVKAKENPWWKFW